MLALCMSEYLVLSGMHLSDTAKLIFLCILIKGCIQCYVYPAPMVIRYVVLYTGFWAACLKVVDALSDDRQGAKRHHMRHAMARTAQATSRQRGDRLPDPG